MNDKDLFYALSWWIIEQKWIYYELNGLHPEANEDWVYDLHQRKYEELGEALKKDISATLLPGIDKTRPSVIMVANRLHKKPQAKPRQLI